MSFSLRVLPLSLLGLVAPLGAQQLRVTPLAGADSLLLSAAHAARVAPAEASRSRMRVALPSNRSLFGTAGGAIVGAFLGYFASQVVQSDWDEETGKAGTDRRAFTIGGAMVGAFAGYAIMRPRSGTSVNERLPRAEASYDSRDRDIIVQSEIAASGATNAYDLVQARRPQWLNARGTNTFREEGRVLSNSGRSIVIQQASDESIVVYLDRARIGSVERLKDISVTSFIAVQHLDARAATLRFGSGHDHGAIVLVTK